MTRHQAHQASQKGFVAITSAVVISALLILISASLSYSGFFARFNVLETEFKKESLAYAETCVDMARINIVNTPGFTVVEQKENLDDDFIDTECLYAVTLSGGEYTIQAEANYNHAISRINAVVTRTATNIPVVSWKEVSNF